MAKSTSLFTQTNWVCISKLTATKKQRPHWAGVATKNNTFTSIVVVQFSILNTHNEPNFKRQMDLEIPQECNYSILFGLWMNEQSICVCFVWAIYSFQNSKITIGGLTHIGRDVNVLNLIWDLKYGKLNWPPIKISRKK